MLNLSWLYPYLYLVFVEFISSISCRELILPLDLLLAFKSILSWHHAVVVFPSPLPPLPEECEAARGISWRACDFIHSVSFLLSFVVSLSFLS